MSAKNKKKNKKKLLKTTGHDPAPSSTPTNLPRLFLLIGGFFGLVMLVLTPPFQVPDEHDHFFRAVMISSGQFVAKSYPFSEELKKIDLVNDSVFQKIVPNLFYQALFVSFFSQ